MAIRGCGMFWGVQMEEKYDLRNLQLRLLKAGIITCSSRNNTLRLTPPLTMKRAVLEESLETIKEELAKN